MEQVGTIIDRAIENGLYERRTFKSFDELREALFDNIAVYDTDPIGLSIELKLDLCYHAQEEDSEGFPACKWEDLLIHIENNACQGLFYLASEQMNELLNAVEELIEKKKIEWEHLRITSSNNFSWVAQRKKLRIYSPKSAQTAVLERTGTPLPD